MNIRNGIADKLYNLYMPFHYRKSCLSRFFRTFAPDF